MRNINLIIIHCSASDHQKHDNLASIMAWHMERGFRTIGYHYVITQDGKVHIGRDVADQGAHCARYNTHSIGICLTGEFDFSEKQFLSLKFLTSELAREFGIDHDCILPHNFFNPNKTCPNFILPELFNE